MNIRAHTVVAPVLTQRAAESLADAMIEAAHYLLVRGVSPVDLDEALVEFGFQFGPLEAQDLAGLEPAYLRRKASKPDKKSRAYLESGLMISDRMVHEGRLGKISGVGWYRYPGGKGKVEDPLLEDLIKEEAHFASIEQQLFSADEIVDCVLLKLQEEISQILAQSSTTGLDELIQICIDVLGFPVEKARALTSIDAVKNTVP